MRRCFHWIVFAITMALPMLSLATAGKFLFVSGPVRIQESSGKTTLVKTGFDINQGDLILTESGRAQIRFNDGALVSLQPNTQFRIDQYRYNNKPDGNEIGFFSLIKGTLRTVTGLIGKSKHSAYQVRTPSATIGIRGTDYSATQDDVLHVSVSIGQIDVSNDAGSLLVSAGESAVVNGPDSLPTLTDKPAAPTENNPVPPALDSIVDPIRNTTPDAPNNSPKDDFPSRGPNTPPPTTNFSTNY